MTIFANILAAFGLSSSAGLNAYLPLLVVALAARFTNLIELKSPWDTLENPWVIGALVVLLTIEFFADKIPAVNHANDAIQTQDYKTAVGALKKYLEVNPQAGDAQQIKGYIKQLEPLVGAATPGQ